MKRCNSCGVAKPNTAFTKQKGRNGKYNLLFECKECACKTQKIRYQNLTPEQKLKKKDRFIQRTYGITMEDYNIMFQAQEGCCKSCKRHQSNFTKALVIDHCHRTKQIRGLLCSGCNLALGNVGESALYLRALANYIEKSNN